MDVGTCKTLTSLAYAADMSARNILIATTDKAVTVFPKDIAKHVDQARYLELNKISIPKRMQALNTVQRGTYDEPLFVIVNYEAMWREPLASALHAFRFDLVLSDEAQKIKSHNSKQGKFLHQLGKSIDARVGLTATPFHNGPLDIFGIARFLDDRVFGKSWNKFRYTYARYSEYNRHVLIEYRNLDDLYQKTSTFSFRVESSVLDLPEERVIVHPIAMPNNVRKAYKSFSKDMLYEFDNGTVVADNPLVKLLRLHQLTGGNATFDDGKTVLIDAFKGKALAEFIDSFPMDEPLVIFYKFEADLALIWANVNRDKGVLNGSQNEYEDWVAGKFPVLIVQVGAGGAGIDLTRARYSIIYSMGFSLGDFTQLKGRLHRPGQTRAVTHYVFAVEDSIDTYALEAIETKAEPTNYILSRLRGYR